MAAATAIAPSLTGVQKAAILLVALGDEASGAMLKHLSDDEVEQVSAAIANLPAVPLAQAEAILEEFREAVNGALQVGHGGRDYARRVLAQAFGPDGSKKHIERLPPARDRQSPIQQQLQRIDPQTLMRMVRAEHPQTAALILSRLSPGQSAAVLASMEPALRMNIAVRIALLNKISPAVFTKISAVIGTKLKSMGEVQRESSGGPRAAAEIFNQLDPAMCDELLELMGADHAALVEEIRQKKAEYEAQLQKNLAALNGA